MIRDQNKNEIVKYVLGGFEKDIGNCLADFTVLQVLGQNKYGFVAKVKSLKNNQIYAMKKNNLSLAERERRLKYYKNEVLFMKQLDHENICKYYTHFNEQDCLYIIMEYVDNGNLLNLIYLKNKLNEEKLIYIFLGCLRALNYIHSKGVIHRNIKPSNIVLDSTYQIKLIDFKMAAVDNIDRAQVFSKDDSQKAELVNHMTRVGAGAFKAPEIDNDISISIQYDNKVDIYSMGITFCCLAYSDDSFPDSYDNISCNYSKELYKIIGKMVKANPTERPSSLDLYNELKILYSKKYFYNTGIISSIIGLGSFPLIDKILNKNEGTLNNIISNQCIQCKYTLKELKNVPEDEKEKSWNASIYEFRELLRKYGFKEKLKYNKEISPIYIICFLLKKMHKELNLNIRNNINDNEIMFSVRENKEEAYNTYVNFYNKHFSSPISDNFFGAIKIKKTCEKCKYTNYSNCLYYFIPFNVQILTNKYYQKKNDLNIYDAFDCLNKNPIILDEKDKIICLRCKAFTKHFQFKQIYNFPNNLIIYFDRGSNFKYKTYIHFGAKLKLNRQYVEAFSIYPNGVIYDLCGVICREEEYDENAKNKRKEKYIVFIKYNNKYLNFNNNKECDLSEIKNTGDIITLFYYCNSVKGINNNAINNNNNCINNQNIMNSQNMNNNNLNNQNNQNMMNNNIIMNNQNNQNMMNNNIIMNNQNNQNMMYNNNIMNNQNMMNNNIIMNNQNNQNMMNNNIIMNNQNNNGNDIIVLNKKILEINVNNEILNNNNVDMNNNYNNMNNSNMNNYGNNMNNPNMNNYNNNININNNMYNYNNNMNNNNNNMNSNNNNMNNNYMNSY